MQKNYSPTELSTLFKERAYQAGFELVGIATARELTDEARRLEAWLNMGMQGKMAYMENHFDKRIDPRKLVEGAKTIISLAFNYYPQEQQEETEDKPKIAKYAYGKDYHKVLKDKLFLLMAELEELAGHPVQGRCFTDSAPVLERDWAKHAGLGWIGKNTLLINPKKGSFFFLAELIIDLEMQPDGPMKDYCGRCRRCIDACPTEAISPEGYLLDASRCISYFTIELKEEIAKEFRGQFENWAFGCDICQDVCPWNRFAKAHQEPEFAPVEGLLDMRKQDWLELTEEVFKKRFKDSPIKRTKYQGMLRNLKFLDSDSSN